LKQGRHRDEGAEQQRRRCRFKLPPELSAAHRL
jgi:hypothetical protein